MNMTIMTAQDQWSTQLYSLLLTMTNRCYWDPYKEEQKHIDHHSFPVASIKRLQLVNLQHLYSSYRNIN